MSKQRRTKKKPVGLIATVIIVALIATAALLFFTRPDTGLLGTATPTASAVKSPATGAVNTPKAAVVATPAPTKSAAAPKSDLVIPISSVSDKVSFYPVTVDGTKMEVLAVKAPDGTIRTAFNTCQVCYDSGQGYYKQEGNVLVCQNCGNRFKMSDIEVVKGGCNPVPILKADKTVTSTSITIGYDVLSEASALFENWKY